MRIQNLLIGLTGLLILGFGAGCGRSEPTSMETKPLEEYKEKAEREITADNAEAELEKLEKEIESETE